MNCPVETCGYKCDTYMELGEHLSKDKDMHSQQDLITSIISIQKQLLRFEGGRYDENGFMLDYIPEKCAECNSPMEPMLDYLTLSEPNTDEPENTTYHFDKLLCLGKFILKNGTIIQGHQIKVLDVGTFQFGKRIKD